MKLFLYEAMSKDGGVSQGVCIGSSIIDATERICNFYDGCYVKETHAKEIFDFDDCNVTQLNERQFKFFKENFDVNN